MAENDVSEAEIPDNQRETMMDQLMRMSRGETAVISTIEADCLIAEKDADLMNLYWAGVEQMKAVHEELR